MVAQLTGQPVPRFRVTFQRMENYGTGNVQSLIYVGNPPTVYQAGDWIPLNHIDNALVADVPGIAVARQSGNKMLVHAHGMHASGSGKEIVDIKILFDGIDVSHVDLDSGINAPEAPFNEIVNDTEYGDEVSNSTFEVFFQTRVEHTNDAIIIRFGPSEEQSSSEGDDDDNGDNGGDQSGSEDPCASSQSSNDASSPDSSTDSSLSSAESSACSCVCSSSFSYSEEADDGEDEEDTGDDLEDADDSGDADDGESSYSSSLSHEDDGDNDGDGTSSYSEGDDADDSGGSSSFGYEQCDFCPACVACRRCGYGLGNVCDEQECGGLGLCVFQDGLFVNECLPDPGVCGVCGF